MAMIMAACGAVATWCCVLAAALALGSVMGQDDNDLPNMKVPSYQNGRLTPVDPYKFNTIFVCGSGNCVTQCPDECPNGIECQISCDHCKTWCGCVPAPGVTCGDPSFTGGDGLTFYFHGKKDQDFCIVSDANLHINAHFIGNYNPANERTFTWIQAIGVSFGDHQIYIGARKAIEWDEEDDHIQITFDGEPINLDTTNNARWMSKVLPGLSMKRTNILNSVMVELDGVFNITASAVPITEKDSKVHNYGRTKKDSLVHLDLRFKFHSLTDVVDGVLGQTYRSDYVNKMNITAKMPVMGGTPKYLSAGLFSTNCAVSKFQRRNGTHHVYALAE